MAVNTFKPPAIARRIGDGNFEIILVGGGLQNCLIAKSVLTARPQTRLLLVESADRLAGDHIWCFHAQDLPVAVERACDDFVEHRWDSYDVKFPAFSRRLQSGYAMMTSDRVRRAVETAFRGSSNARRLLGAEVISSQPGSVELRTGQQFAAPLVIDSCGPASLGLTNARRDISFAFQKFLGLELELAFPHQLSRPTLIDATVPQLDGFRFVYLLPLSPSRLLVEDTYFSTDAELDFAQLERRVMEYVQSRELRVKRVVRRESGVLPLPLGRMPAPNVATTPRGLLVTGGYAGGWFHPTTGYSTPGAARLAEYLMNTQPSRVSAEGINGLRRDLLQQARFGIWLNRLMFRAFNADDRYAPLEHFYGLPPETIERFYALKMTTPDRMRLFCGKPPRGFSASRLLLNTAFPRKDNLGVSA